MIQNHARTRIGRASLFIFVISLVFGCAWLNRAAILHGVADLWVVSDPIEDADAAVVLGGGVNTRPFAAAALYKAGTVKFALLPVVRSSQIEDFQIIPSHTEINRAILIKLGVAPQAIIDVGHDVSNTYEEVRAVREWAQHNSTKKIIVVTEMFPSRRVRWIFNRELAMIGVKVIVHPLPNPEFFFERWWQNEQGIIVFQNEVLKYLYYRLMY